MPQAGRLRQRRREKSDTMILRIFYECDKKNLKELANEVEQNLRYISSFFAITEWHGSYNFKPTKSLSISNPIELAEFSLWRKNAAGLFAWGSCATSIIILSILSQHILSLRNNLQHYYTSNPLHYQQNQQPPGYYEYNLISVA